MRVIVTALAVGMILLVALAIGSWVLDRSRGDARLTPTFRRQRPGWLRLLPYVLLTAAVVCLGLAVSQFTIERREAQAAVILLMDTSNTMTRTDVLPNRLAAAQDAARAFLRELPEGFRVGLVSYAAESRLHVPPVADRAQVLRGLDGLTTSRGTLTGDGLATALDALEGDRAQYGDRPSAVVLLSDGLDTSGSRRFTPTLEPDAAAARAKDLEVKVYTIGLGAVDPPDGGGIDAELLRRIAETSGGEMFTALTADQLSRVYQELGSDLSVALAVGGSGPMFVVLGALFAVAAGVVVLLGSRQPY